MAPLATPLDPHLLVVINSCDLVNGGNLTNDVSEIEIIV